MKLSELAKLAAALPSDRDLQRADSMGDYLRNMRSVEGENAEVINAMRGCLIQITDSQEGIRRAYLALRDVILQAEVD